MNAITRLVNDKLTAEQESWIRGLSDQQLRGIMTYMPGISMCPPGMAEEIKRVFGDKWGKTARIFCQTENQRRQNNELLPPTRREEYVMPRGGSIEYGVNAVKVSVPGLRPQEFVACPLPTTRVSPDPDLVRTAAVISQFADIKKGELAFPVNAEAVAQYSGLEGFADGARVSLIPSIVSDIVTSSVVFSNDLKKKETVSGEAFAQKVIDCLHLLKKDERFVLNWQLITEVFRCCRRQADGTLHFFLDKEGQKLYDKSAVAESKKDLSPEDLEIWEMFKKSLKYPPLKFGVVRNKVKAPEPTDESFRRMVRATAASVGVSRGLGKIVANLDYCTGQSEQVRLACWYKAMVLSCGVAPGNIDVKCGPGVGQLLLSQLKDEIAQGLAIVIGDSKARYSNAVFRSERRAKSHVICYMDGVIAPTPKEKKVDKDIEVHHKTVMESLLLEARSLYSHGWTIAIPVNHSVLFDGVNEHVYALRNNFNCHAIVSTVKLNLTTNVVPFPYDYEPPTSSDKKSYDCTLGSVIVPIPNWLAFKKHTITAMTNAMSFYINPVYSCTALGRLFSLDGTVEYALIENELVYVGRSLESAASGPPQDTLMRFDDDEDMFNVLKTAGVRAEVVNTTANVATTVTNIVVGGPVAEEKDFDVDDL